MPYSIREALAAFTRAPLLTGLSAAMVALALFVVGLFAVAVHNLQVNLDAVESRVQIVAFLQDDALAMDVDLAQAELQALPEVESVRLVTKEEALAAARRDLPEFEEVFTDLQGNPLPASLEVRLAEYSRNAESLEAVAHQARLYSFVEDVRFGEEWVEQLFMLRRIGALTTALLGAAFGAAAALIIATAIRIAIFARKDEIQVMRLVGATAGFVRRPFLIEGGICGFLGGVVALLLTFLVFQSIQGMLFELAWLPRQWIIVGILVATGFGVVASAIAVRRYLREV